MILTMSFALQSVLGYFIKPSNLFFLLFVLSVISLWTPWRRRGRTLLSALLVVTLVLMLLPLPALLAAPLENRISPPAELPREIDGILVLGGAVIPGLSAVRGQVALNDGAERMTAAVLLAQRYPEARIVFSGGSSILGATATEAQAARQFFSSFGLPASRIVFENRARNTVENARYSYELVGPNEGDTWLLVTSALHMPRAVGAFRGAGWSVIPYPVDYQSARRPAPIVDLSYDVIEELVQLDRVVTEWVALVAYRAFGWTPTLLPSAR